MKPFISLCMIVKNEENVLRRCLESVNGIVDEIVIVDTGSTDTTVEIAKEYTEKVYEYEWNNNFSEARNYAASKANGDWILVLDADEYVERNNLKEAISELKINKDKYDIYAVNIVNFVGGNGENTFKNKHGRIYKNNNKIKYVRSIHEQLHKVDGELSIAISSLVVYHSGYLSSIIKTKEKRKRNIPLIKNELKDGENIAFDYFNLGNEFRAKGQIESALKNYIKAYQNKGNPGLDWVAVCLVNIIDCLIKLERYEEALNIIVDAEEIYSSKPDVTYLKGEIYYLQHRYDDAKQVFLNILRNKDNYVDVITSPDFKEFLPNFRLGEIYEREKDFQNSVQHYAGALNFNHTSIITTGKLIKILQKFHSEEEIFEFIDSNFLKKQDSKLFLQIIMLCMKLGMMQLASLIANKYFQKDELIRRIVNAKVDIYSININEIIYKHSLNEILLSGFKLGIIDTEDFFVTYLKSNDAKIKRQIEVILSQSRQIRFIKKIMGETVTFTEKDTNEYLKLIEKCIVTKQLDVIDLLINMKEEFKNINGKLGNLFYSHGYKDIAIEFYELENECNINEQDYVNIIEWLIENHNMNEAIRICNNAVNRFNKDFRFYKYLLTLYNKSDEKYYEILENALTIFKDSDWLNRHLMAKEEI